MSILVLDCESSGLVRHNLETGSDEQPHLLQLALKLMDDEGTRLHRWTALVKPDGWSIEPEAFEVHGISERRAMRYGLPLLEVIRPLRLLVPLAKVIVGHGIQNFDRLLISAELGRLSVKTEWWDERGADMVDTAELAAPYCDVGLVGGQPKYPTLAEAHLALVGIPHIEDHDAQSDADAAGRIYLAIREREAKETRQ